MPGYVLVGVIQNGTCNTASTGCVCAHVTANLAISCSIIELRSRKHLESHLLSRHPIFRQAGGWSSEDLGLKPTCYRSYHFGQLTWPCSLGLVKCKQKGDDRYLPVS